MLNIKDIVEATDGRIISTFANDFSGVSIDSRTIKQGELFIALKGDRFDGHDFFADALKKGNGAIVNSSYFMAHNLQFSDKTIITVDNTLFALHNLARYRRNKFNGRVIGVVGSNGKTTTKELISSILSIKLNVLKTAGNLNNHIGMPLSIIRGDKKSEIMVLEMGTNSPGDINTLCNIALPDIGVITNIGFEHLQGFGSLQRVRDSELEIFPYVKKIIVNADDAFLMDGIRDRMQKKEHGKQTEIITFGIDKKDADLTARDIVFSDEGTQFIISAGSEHMDINFKISGRFNIYNAIAAASAAYAIGFNLKEIKEGLESFSGINMRFEIKRYEGAILLNDVYNANPSSMQESINELIRFITAKDKKGCKYKRAIAVLGDMLELGDYGIAEHRKLGQRLSELPVDIFIGVGNLMSYAVNEFKKNGISVNASDDAGLELSKIIKKGDIVLIKGSRGMKMENVIDFLIKGQESFHAV